MMWKEEVRPEGPYHFDRALRRLAFEPLFAIDLHAQSIRVPLWIDGKPVVADVESKGTVERPCFLVSCSDTQKTAVLDRLTEIFQWQRSLAVVAQHFAKTDLKSLVDDYAGTPLVTEFSLYRSLMKSIIHQQLNLKFVNTLTERWVKTYGFQKEGVWFYPRPETAANVPIEDLREMQFSQKKAEYVIGASKMIADGQLSLQALREAENEDVMRTLMDVRGIGKWTAEVFLLFGLGRENLLPAADIGLQNAVKKYYGYDQKPKADDIRELGKAWAPYQSYATLYFWESLGSHTVSAS